MCRVLGESVELFLDSWVACEVGVPDQTVVYVKHVDDTIREASVSELRGRCVEDDSVLVVGENVVDVYEERVVGEFDQLTDHLSNRLSALDTLVSTVQYRIDRKGS